MLTVISPPVLLQPPAAIKALTAIFRWVMYPRPYLAPYLPALLELTLAGVDANDVFKTATTLKLYHLILCWVPVQGNPVRRDALFADVAQLLRAM